MGIIFYFFFFGGGGGGGLAPSAPVLPPSLKHDAVPTIFTKPVTTKRPSDVDNPPPKKKRSAYEKHEHSRVSLPCYSSLHCLDKAPSKGRNVSFCIAYKTFLCCC